jgi:DNA polymerase alpha subunit B
MQYGEKMQGQPMSIHVAAGPFTVDDNLDYEPLQALMEVAEKERPDVLILVSPEFRPV